MTIVITVGITVTGIIVVAMECFSFVHFPLSSTFFFVYFLSFFFSFDEEGNSRQAQVGTNSNYSATTNNIKQKQLTDFSSSLLFFFSFFF